MDEAEWVFLTSFGIDHGELDGLSPQEIFCLGVEWQTVYEQAKKPFAFEQSIRVANRDRIEVLLKEQQRSYKLTYMDNDVSEAYMWLRVEGDFL